jgi:transcriptional regulator with XRE-family HTH domain
MRYAEYRKKLADNPEFMASLDELRLPFAFGDAVIRERLRKGWSQAELARRIGTKQANISRIEAGLANPTLYLVQKLCKVLDLEIRFNPVDIDLESQKLYPQVRQPITAPGYEMPEKLVHLVREVTEDDE